MKEDIRSKPVSMKCTECHGFIGLLLVNNAAFVDLKEVAHFMNTNTTGTLCPSCYTKMWNTYKDRNKEKMMEIDNY